MPFKSQAQRRFMHANDPAMAERWERHTPEGKKLPERAGKRSSAKGKDCRPAKGRSRSR